jgi:hypothetical protein
MEDFKKLPKMQCFKEGGSVRNPMKTGGLANKMCGGGKAYKEGGHAESEEMSKDIAQDKKIIKKAFKMHDEQEHKGEKTDLSKLKKGGRMKKEGGCVGRYKAGGEVVNVYEAKKKSGDKDAIKKVKQIKPTKAEAPSKAATLPAMEGTTNVMKKGGATKKYAEGGSLKPVDSEENPGLAKLPTNVRNKMGYQKKGGTIKKYADGGMVSDVEKMRLANRAKNRAMLSPSQQAELDRQEAAAAARMAGQGGVSDSERGMLGRILGRKKGGKACR